MNFCRRCGKALELLSESEYVCSSNHKIYANSPPASGIWIVNDNNEVLVAIRAHEPGTDKYDTPGGFAVEKESYESSINRELQEELGLSASDYTKPEYLTSGIDAYHWGGEEISVSTVIYWAHIIGNPRIKASDDVAEARFIPINDIELEKVYFDTPRTGLIMLKKILNTV